jgi:hypothetical protein
MYLRSMSSGMPHMVDSTMVSRHKEVGRIAPARRMTEPRRQTTDRNSRRRVVLPGGIWVEMRKVIEREFS